MSIIWGIIKWLLAVLIKLVSILFWCVSIILVVLSLGAIKRDKE